jgi:hypothetical protein
MGSLACRECEELLGIYGEANRKLLDAAKRLKEIAISREADLFKRVWREMQVARFECMNARDAFLSHCNTHGEGWAGSGLTRNAGLTET